jgi:uncharacterized LabA/DUF88 family protein
MISMKHKDQRVLVLFDVQNMYYSAKHIYNTKVNFKEILNEAVAGRKLVRAIAYVIKTEIKDEANFHEALNKIGIEVKAKDLQIFIGGAKKGDWDIGIAMDAVRLQPKIDTIVLVSGDGDFKDLLAYMKSHGCRTEVIAVGKTASKHIKEEADEFFDLESNPRRFLINYKGKFKPFAVNPLTGTTMNSNKLPIPNGAAENVEHVHVKVEKTPFVQATAIEEEKRPEEKPAAKEATANDKRGIIPQSHQRKAPHPNLTSSNIPKKRMYDKRDNRDRRPILKKPFHKPHREEEADEIQQALIRANLEQFD